ncbi:protein kinase C-binding protein NELL2-like isoform X1 [Stylophora pistillata]|uniref:protein kinase C-binding protein NELL2-like isoform X1 n=1 Tax=Stylophora pistillata TaxID=50429 RepID=UPI000C0531DA|nr:protein kinase C-binding protein NELL2-like isoform X1 [Stylophora pistillata]
MMLKGHTYRSFKFTPGTLECREACLADDRCQSYNVVMFIAICELNNRTKEVRPEDFVKDEDRYYMAKGPKRVPLGSTRELPARSCQEIKASEGGQAVSGNYWLDSTRSGNSILARCDMRTEVADYCVKHRCQNDAKCVNQETNYSCTCNSSGWTGTFCEKDVNECKEGLNRCHANATCYNTEGSYNCSCKTEFLGDGRNYCKAMTHDYDCWRSQSKSPSRNWGYYSKIDAIDLQTRVASPCWDTVCGESIAVQPLSRSPSDCIVEVP